ncbi:ABC transporter substrate-binding protein [Jeotgalibaca caeni]|uniref:ABC transporter substrate-binding protein n=1 Tax=Jeotgalibaca caeni TaxID=3028623 RepID=UPI00237DFC46|nr:sugar ABC transporter substrate-binding protein [Jeotgalibaca caeni]MDE1549294.1 sugar ABC transporter substrate-binding protein [Jeotgalibaca caeni]
MKRKGIITSLILGSFLILSACSSADSETDQVTLYVSGDVSEGSAYTKMAEKYEEETGIHVEVTDIPYADLTTKISTAVQSDDAPDVARVSGVVPDWAEYLMDLSSVAEEANTIESMTIKNEEGIVKALPTDITAVGMFINTDLFDQAGVSYPTSEEDIWTWDEFIASVEEVKTNTDARFGMVMDGSDHRLRAFTYQFGGKDFFLNEDETSYMTDENTIKAIERFYELNNNGFMPKSVWTAGEDAASMFKSGQIPAYMSGSWQIKDFSENIDFNWQAVYMPYQEVRATNMGGNFLVGFENGANPEGGRAFIEWLYQPENYTQLATYAGYLPALEDIEVTYEGGQEAYDIYIQEIAAADEISGKQTSDQVTKTMRGFTGLTGSYRDSVVQYLNDEIDLETVIENTIKDYNDGYLEE